MKLFSLFSKKKPEFLFTGTVGNWLPIYPAEEKIGILSVGSIQENNINRLPQTQGGLWIHFLNKSLWTTNKQ